MITTKLIQKLIREEIAKVISEDVQATIHVKNLSQSNLWYGEIVGQISDGAWENAKPMDHWEVWSDAEVIIGQPVGYFGFTPKRTEYNLDVLLPIVGSRMLVMGAAGKAGLNLETDKLTKGALESFFISGEDEATELVSKLKNTPYDSLEKIFLDRIDSQSWMKRYEQSYNQNKDSFKKIYTLISTNAYGSGNLKTDLNDLKVAMRSHLSNKEDKTVRESRNTKSLSNLRSTIYEGVRKSKQSKK